MNAEGLVIALPPSQCHVASNRIGRAYRRDPYLARRRFSGQTHSGRYSWARYYHPGLQRFISEDPIGQAGGTNLYAYVSNQPIRYRDPSGLFRDELRNWSNGYGWVTNDDAVKNVAVSMDLTGVTSIGYDPTATHLGGVPVEAITNSATGVVTIGPGAFVWFSGGYLDSIVGHEISHVQDYRAGVFGQTAEVRAWQWEIENLERNRLYWGAGNRLCFRCRSLRAKMLESYRRELKTYFEEWPGESSVNPRSLSGRK